MISWNKTEKNQKQKNKQNNFLNTSFYIYNNVY